MCNETVVRIFISFQKIHRNLKLEPIILKVFIHRY